MKKFITISVFSAFLMGAAGNASAFFWDDDNDWKCWGPYGKIPDCNPYDEWDPRYWMEEMSDSWDDDDDYYRYGGGYGMPYGGGYGMPYGGGYGMPYGGYGAPYGGGYGAPYGGGYGAPYGGGYAPAPYGGYAAPQYQAPAPVPETQPAQ